MEEIHFVRFYYACQVFFVLFCFFHNKISIKQMILIQLSGYTNFDTSNILRASAYNIYPYLTKNIDTNFLLVGGCNINHGSLGILYHEKLLAFYILHQSCNHWLFYCFKFSLIWCQFACRLLSILPYSFFFLIMKNCINLFLFFIVYFFRAQILKKCGFDAIKEPCFQTEHGLLKPDLVVVTGE